MFNFFRSSESHGTASTPSCLFCGVSDAPDKFKIVWEDEQFVGFKDHRPGAREHILLCPKKHVDSVQALTKEDVPFLQEMRRVANLILDKLDVAQADRRLGFHIPPLILIRHLHLHVFALPHVSSFREFEYRAAPGYGEFHKGFGWFVDVEQTIRILEDDKVVGIRAC